MNTQASSVQRVCKNCGSLFLKGDPSNIYGRICCECNMRGFIHIDPPPGTVYTWKEQTLPTAGSFYFYAPEARLVNCHDCGQQCTARQEKSAVRCGMFISAGAARVRGEKRT